MVVAMSVGRNELCCVEEIQATGCCVLFEGQCDEEIDKVAEEA